MSKSKKTKIEESELEKLKGLHRAFTNAKDNVASYALYHSRALSQLDKIDEALVAFQNELSSKYGEGARINMNTGELITE